MKTLFNIILVAFFLFSQSVSAKLDAIKSDVILDYCLDQDVYDYWINGRSCFQSLYSPETRNKINFDSAQYNKQENHFLKVKAIFEQNGFSLRGGAPGILYEGWNLNLLFKLGEALKRKNSKDIKSSYNREYIQFNETFSIEEAEGLDICVVGEYCSNPIWDDPFSRMKHSILFHNAVKSALNYSYFSKDINVEDINKFCSRKEVQAKYREDTYLSDYYKDHDSHWYLFDPYNPSDIYKKYRGGLKAFNYRYKKAFNFRINKKAKQILEEDPNILFSKFSELKGEEIKSVKLIFPFAFNSNLTNLKDHDLYCSVVTSSGKVSRRSETVNYHSYLFYGKPFSLELEDGLKQRLLKKVKRYNSRILNEITNHKEIRKEYSDENLITMLKNLNNYSPAETIDFKDTIKRPAREKWEKTIDFNKRFSKAFESLPKYIGFCRHKVRGYDIDEEILPIEIKGSCNIDGQYLDVGSSLAENSFGAKKEVKITFQSEVRVNFGSWKTDWYSGCWDGECLQVVKEEYPRETSISYPLEKAKQNLEYLYAISFFEYDKDPRKRDLRSRQTTPTYSTPDLKYTTKGSMSGDFLGFGVINIKTKDVLFLHNRPRLFEEEVIDNLQASLLKEENF